MSVTLIIKGIVQGVGFRYWTKQNADELSLKGTVQNLKDGSVRAYISGDDADVKRFIDLARNGPNTAMVSEILIQYKDDLPSFSKFDILR